MIYQVLSPIATVIEGDSYKEAIKNFVKINYDMAIKSMIIQDQMNHYQAKMKYYKENNKNKIGITVYPYTNVPINSSIPNQLLTVPVNNSIIPNQIIPNQMLPMLINSSNNNKLIKSSNNKLGLNPIPLNPIPLNPIPLNSIPLNTIPLNPLPINNQMIPFGINNLNSPIISYI